MEDKEILLNIRDYEYDNAFQLAKLLKISEKEAEEKLKELEKKGLIEIEGGDETIAEGESRDYIYEINLTNKSKNLLEE